MPNLTIKDKGREFVYQVEGDAVSIGRTPVNTVEIHDAKASKEHCRIERRGNRWRLIDLESKNGTKVNGEYRNKAWLDHGDTVTIGMAQIRFGVGGAARKADAPQPSSSRAAAAAAPARATARSAATRPAAARTASRRDDPDDEDERPLPPPRRGSSGDKALIISLAVLGVIIVLFIVGRSFKGIQRSPYHEQLLSRAEELIGRGEWNEAEAYLESNKDPDEPGYEAVENRIKEIRDRKDAFYQNRKEEDATKIVSKLGRRIQSYHRGADVDPDDILKLVEELKTKFADTEVTADARREWPAWFLGKVPDSAVSLLASGGRLRRDWETAKETADGYRKEWRFREARETVIRFVTTREGVVADETLDRFKRERDDYLDTLDRLASSVFTGRRAAADRKVKNRRYEEAIAIYREVIEKFGLDEYARKAAAEIDKVKAAKTAAGGG